METTLVKLIAKEIAKTDSLVNLNRKTEVKVDFTISGSAIVKKGEDYEQISSFAVPYDRLVAVLLSKLNGVTLEAVLREAMDEDLDVSLVKAQASEALKRIKGTAVRASAGKLTITDEILEASNVDVCLNC